MTCRPPKELGKICDEHNDDDINELLNFYRGVGGIQNLVHNPNVPLSKVRPQIAISDSNEEDDNITGYF